MRYYDPRLADLLAAEYVLGTLKGGARRRFERLAQAHPALRNRVRQWEMQLNRLAQLSSPVAPPPETWRALEQRLFPTPPRPRWFERLGLWRNLALGSSLLAGVLAAVLIMSPPQVAPGGYVGMIGDAAHQAVWMVSAPETMDRIKVKNLMPMDLPPGKRCLLWVQPKGSQAVYALGMLPERGEERTLPVPEAMRPMLDGKLLVTVEPMDGALPAQPSGKPEYQGDWMPWD